MHFRFNWKVTLFSVFFLILFINLGFWQLRRADYKVRLLAQQAQREHQPARTLARIPADPKRADELPVILEGSYDKDHTFLLDNRVLNGRVGFEVLVPFHDTSTNQYALVNRGFVPMGRTRHDVPRVPPLATNSTVATGSVHVTAEDGHPSHRGTSVLAPGMTIVEDASPALVSRLIHKPFYPHMIRLARSDPNALPRYWPVTMMMPSRHRAYAVQWFLMAVAVVGAWGAFSFRRARPEPDETA